MTTEEPYELSLTYGSVGRAPGNRCLYPENKYKIRVRDRIVINISFFI